MDKPIEMTEEQYRRLRQRSFDAYLASVRPAEPRDEGRSPTMRFLPHADETIWAWLAREREYFYGLHPKAVEDAAAALGCHAGDVIPYAEAAAVRIASRARSRYACIGRSALADPDLSMG